MRKVFHFNNTPNDLESETQIVKQISNGNLPVKVLLPLRLFSWFQIGSILSGFN